MTSRLRDIALRLFGWMHLVDVDRIESWRRSEQDAHRETEHIQQRIQRATGNPLADRYRGVRDGAGD